MSKFSEKFMKTVFGAAALVSVAAVVLICWFLFSEGLPAIGKVGFWNFITGKEWLPSDNPPKFGILPMIAGSVYVTAGALVSGVPIGILTAVFLTEYCNKKVYRRLKPAVDLLAGIPSIVYGFFGLTVIVPFVRNTFGGSGNSILSAALLLGIMILPTVTAVSEASLKNVPSGYMEGALALGASRERSVFAVVIPAAKSGILAATVLGCGRAVGETMAVIAVEGNQARMPAGILKGVRTLTADIVLEMGYATGLHREVLIASGVVLFIFILIINLSFSYLQRR